MLCLPWLGAVVYAAVPACLLEPRPALPRPERLLIVGAVPQTADVVADPAVREPKTIGSLSGLALFDLQAGSDEWLACWPRGAVARRAVSFEPRTLQRYLAHGSIDTGGAPLEVELGLPLEIENDNPVVLVTVRSTRLWPPATWDHYLYRVGAAEPRPLLVQRDLPAPLVLRRDTSGRLAFSSSALERRGQSLLWNGDRYVLVESSPAERLQRALAGIASCLRWWMIPLAALPVVALLQSCGGVLAEAGDRWRYAPASVAAVDALAALALFVVLAFGGYRALAWLRELPSRDLLCGLLAPVTFAAVVALPLRLLRRQIAQRW